MEMPWSFKEKKVLEHDVTSERQSAARRRKYLPGGEQSAVTKSELGRSAGGVQCDWQ